MQANASQYVESSLWSIYLSLLGLLSSTFFFSGNAKCDDALSLTAHVELKDSNYRGIAQLYGELNLGELSAGSKVHVAFDIVNKSSNSVEFYVVKPSCSCVEVKISSGVLAPDSHLAQKSEAKLSVPHSMGKNTLLGELSLSDQSGSALPVATIAIRATILRPFLLRERRSSFSLLEEEDVSLTIPFDLDPSTKVEQIEFRISLPGKVAVKIERENPTRGQVIIRGKKELMLREESLVIWFSIDHKGSKIEDQLQVDFIDGTRARIVPSVVLAKSGKLQFVVFCLNGIVHQKLRVLDEKGKTIESKALELTKGAARVSLELRDGPVPKNIVITDDKFTVSVPVSIEEE